VQQKNSEIKKNYCPVKLRTKRPCVITIGRRKCVARKLELMVRRGKNLRITKKEKRSSKRLNTCGSEQERESQGGAGGLAVRPKTVRSRHRRNGQRFKFPTSDAFRLPTLGKCRRRKEGSGKKKQVKNIREK